jgi:hypothetical protein
VERALSSVYRSPLVVDTIYEAVLGRYPTVAERVDMFDQVSRGASLGDLVARLEDSDDGIDRTLARIGPVVRTSLRRRTGGPSLEAAGGRRLVFLHIMRVGGTSLSDLLSQWVSPSETRVHLYVDDLLSIPRPLLGGLRVIAGHLPYEALRFIPGAFSTMCVLRDPRERTISHFNTLRAARPAYRDLTLDEFLHDDLYEVPSSNYQARQLAHEIDLAGAWTAYSPEQLYAARGGDTAEPYVLQSLFDSTPLHLGGRDLLHRAADRLADIDIVGVTDNLDNIARKAARLFAVPDQPLARLNRSQSTSVADVPACWLRLIDNRTAIDRELYEIASQRGRQDD